jgi:hypothetical protein
MLISLLVKAIINGNSFKRSNAGRAYELFRTFFIGPDLALLALGLFVSSYALRSLLNGYNISTNFGDDFGTYFWSAVGFAFVCILAATGCWLPYDDDERCFPFSEAEEERQQRDGSKVTKKVYKVHIRSALSNSSGFVVLGIGNFIGVAAIVSYAYFIVAAFYRG